MKSNPAIFKELEESFLCTEMLLDELATAPTPERCAELEDLILDTGNLLSKANDLYPNPEYFALTKQLLADHLKSTHELRERMTRFIKQWNSQ